jgi:hypothetical protein
MHCTQEHRNIKPGLERISTFLETSPNSNHLKKDVDHSVIDAMMFETR